MLNIPLQKPVSLIVETIAWHGRKRSEYHVTAAGRRFCGPVKKTRGPPDPMLLFASHAVQRTQPHWAEVARIKILLTIAFG